MSKDYVTVEKQAQDEFVERRSKFIGYVKPVTTEEEALGFINEIRTRHWDATHNVYAYVIREQNLCRYSDDHEPQGTAGVPVLDVIRKSGLTDVCVVVTRYFGGVLLGAGGLVRAYSHGASIGLAAAGRREMITCYEGKITCSYSQYGKLGSLLPENGATLDDTIFEDNVTLCFHIPVNDIGALNKKVADATGGTCEIEILEEKYYSY